MSNSAPGHNILHVEPGSFDQYPHWYPDVLETTIHPQVNTFFQLDAHQIAERYCQMFPNVRRKRLEKLLHYQPSHYHWAGADLIHATNADGQRQMVLIENNSCPSGQKSMPLPSYYTKQGGYRELLERSFIPFVQRRDPSLRGTYAVLYDKNFLENSGYAAMMADVLGAPVYLVAMFDQPNLHIRIGADRLEIKTSSNTWTPLTAAFRYVTQRPWNRLPVQTNTLIYNPLIACLAGGRNKQMGALAYQRMNADMDKHGLRINTPNTICNVRKKEVPAIWKKLGGQAVVKIPYSNSGQGIFTIINDDELEVFMTTSKVYDKCIVQSMIGHLDLKTRVSSRNLFHVGTLPDEHGHSFAFDLRVMICSTPDGFRPLSLYSRRAASPLSATIQDGTDSWAILGTNLSSKDEHGAWTTDTGRLMMMNHHDFDRLGLSIDDLVEAYVQTVLSTIAIDRMAISLLNRKGLLKTKRFMTLNPDKVLMGEIV